MLIDQKLCRVFGADNVFRSSRSMPAGVIFPPRLVEEATNCVVMLVVIGHDWLAPDDTGKRRIDAPADWVRMEIELALAGSKPIIPVLVGDRPRLGVADNLPASIGDLVRYNYLRFHHRSAEYDLMHIVDEVRPHLGRRDHSTPTPRPTESVLLTTLQPTQRSPDVKLGAAEINGNYYGNSVVFRCDLFASDTRGSISFNLGKRYRRLEATAGVLDNAVESDQIGVFQVVADGVVCEEVTARQGDPRILTVDVTDVLNLKLVAHRPGTTEHPIMAGAMLAAGLSNKLPELAWGNPVVHP